MTSYPEAFGREIWPTQALRDFGLNFGQKIVVYPSTRSFFETHIYANRQAPEEK